MISSLAARDITVTGCCCAAWYRNHWKDVKRFLEHWKSKGNGTFKVYNLTAERSTYQAERLGGELSEFPFEDHQVELIEVSKKNCLLNASWTLSIAILVDCHDSLQAVFTKAFM